MKITVNGESRETRAVTLVDLLGELGVKREGCAVEQNEQVIPRRLLAETELADGDIIEVVSLVGGG